MAKSDVVPSSMGQREIGQMIVLEFTDEEGHVWHAGATITALRLAGSGGPSECRKQLTEGDGLKLSAFKVIT